MSFNSVNCRAQIYVCVLGLHSDCPDCKFSAHECAPQFPILFVCAFLTAEYGQLLFNWKLLSKCTKDIIGRYVYEKKQFNQTYLLRLCVQISVLLMRTENCAGQRHCSMVQWFNNNNNNIYRTYGTYYKYCLAPNSRHHLNV